MHANKVGECHKHSGRCWAQYGMTLFILESRTGKANLWLKKKKIELKIVQKN